MQYTESQVRSLEGGALDIYADELDAAIAACNKGRMTIEEVAHDYALEYVGKPWAEYIVPRWGWTIVHVEREGGWMYYF